MSGGRFHERLLAANRAAWDAMQNHAFVRAIEEDRLPSEAFIRYLSYERALSGMRSRFLDGRW